MTRDEVIKALEVCANDGGSCYDCPGHNDCTKVFRTAIALLKSEQKRGRWVPEPDRERHWHCSVCGYVAGIAAKTFKYCPHCGARMEREP